jgi:hypothetical protein
MSTGPSLKHLDVDVLPTLIVRTDTSQIISFEGTGFLLAPNLLLTCWHCVRAAPPENCSYTTKRPDDDRIHFLINIQQDENNTDLATANIPLLPGANLTLADSNYYEGTDVYAFGFPLLNVERLPGGDTQLALDFRYLKGYVTRVFWFDQPEFGRTMAYELDMSTPEGLSGAPLMKMGSREVIGVVFGSNEVTRITAFARVDPDTGEREPEVHKVMYFGLAHFTEALKKLTTGATRGLPLSEYLKEDFSNRRERYVFYVRGALVGSDARIELPCGCGTVRLWDPPHSTSDLFCSWCDSRFTIRGLMDGAAAVSTPEGIVPVIGTEKGLVIVDDGEEADDEEETFIPLKLGDRIGENFDPGSEPKAGPYVFFIKPGLIGSAHTIILPCMCKTVLRWPPPHDESALECRACGARFILQVVDGPADHVMTGDGSVKIIGANPEDLE